MSSTVLLTQSALHSSAARALFRGVGAMGTSARALIREWRRRERSRWELASYSYDARRDLGFAAALDAEIEKPFWTK